MERFSFLVTHSSFHVPILPIVLLLELPILPQTPAKPL
jgi:hypothetical protein